MLISGKWTQLAKIVTHPCLFTSRPFVDVVLCDILESTNDGIQCLLKFPCIQSQPLLIKSTAKSPVERHTSFTDPFNKNTCNMILSACYYEVKSSKIPSYGLQSHSQIATHSISSKLYKLLKKDDIHILLSLLSAK